MQSNTSIEKLNSATLQSKYPFPYPLKDFPIIPNEMQSAKVEEEARKAMKKNWQENTQSIEISLKVGKFLSLPSHPILLIPFSFYPISIKAII